MSDSSQTSDQDLPTVASKATDDATPAPIGLTSLSLLLPVEAEFRRWRMPTANARIQSIRFAEGPAVAPKDPQQKDRPVAPPPRALQRPNRTELPATVPMRDRLRAVLQPPIETLFGDNSIWLPFQPFPYQFEGIQFLFGRFGAMLGDEMGLGKTMQTILSIRLLLRAGMIRRAMLVCPKPLVTNWQREFRMWADEIPVALITGSTMARRHLWLHDPSAVKLVNYETLSRDEDLFKSADIRFDLMVIDEAQRIKNRDSRTAQVVHAVKRQRSWALTGTPVENNARDLVSLLEFTNNGQKLPEERPDVLREATAKVLLRRTKEMVMSDMPPRLIRDVMVDLAPVQRDRYDLAEKEGVGNLNEMGEAVTIEHVFELIRWLKQICNFDPITGESAKAEHLRSDLEEIAASGKKVILFSQWVTTLEKLAGQLSDFRPMLYHGKINTKERDAVLKEFKENQDRPILMLSYATGAVGLNLQFTNYVLLYDRWWNPAIEDQAINRAHRIGQKDSVFVFRYISPGTIEERIARVLDQKRDLFAQLLDGLDPSPSGLTSEEVFGLFNLRIRPSQAA